jgi:hypothetical protein
MLSRVGDYGWISYPLPGWELDLSHDAGATWPDNLGHVLRREADGWHVDMVNLQGDLIWRDYAVHDDQLHALLCAEQRYLVEEVGAGSVSGETYLDMAEERIRRWREDA